MSRNRNSSQPNEGQSGEIRTGVPLGMAASALYHPHTGHTVQEPPKLEERLSIFWRVFGGTLLSIAALIVLTVYQQFSASMNDLRAGLNRLNEVNGELLKKDEFNTRILSIWSSLKEVTTEITTEVPALKLRTALAESQLKTAEQERKDLAKEVQQMRERLAALESRQGSAPSRTATERDGAH